MLNCENGNLAVLQFLDCEGKNVFLYSSMCVIEILFLTLWHENN